MPTIKTIKANGGGNYTTLQAWANWAATQGSADQWAAVFEDGGNPGEVVLSGWSSTPDATHYPKIYGATQHNGTDTVGAQLESSVATIIDNSLPDARFENLRIHHSNQYGIINRAANVRITGNLFVGTNSTQYKAGIVLHGQDANISGIRVLNNFVIYTGAVASRGDDQTAILVKVVNTGPSGTATVGADIFFNTIVDALCTSSAASGLKAAITVTKTAPLSGACAAALAINNNILATHLALVDASDIVANKSLSGQNILGIGACNQSTGTQFIGDPATVDRVTGSPGPGGGSSGVPVVNLVKNPISDWKIFADISIPWGQGFVLTDVTTDAFGGTRSLHHAIDPSIQIGYDAVLYQAGQPLGNGGDAGSDEWLIPHGLNVKYFTGYTDKTQPFPTGLPTWEGIEANIDHPTFPDPPQVGVDHEHFVVSWEGFITTDWTEFTFITGTFNDGCKVYFNGGLVSDWWNPAATADNTRTLSGSLASMVAGVKYPIRVEYLQLGGPGAAMVLKYYRGSQGPGTAIVVPPKNLFRRLEMGATDSGSHSVLNHFTLADAGACRVNVGSYVGTDCGVFTFDGSYVVTDSGAASHLNSFLAGDLGAHAVSYGSFTARDSGAASVYATFAPLDRGSHKIGYLPFASLDLGESIVQAIFRASDRGVFTVFGGFGGPLLGNCRVANDASDRYELYHGIGSAPDLSPTATPAATFAALPFTLSSLGVPAKHYFVVRKRNAWGLVSENINNFILELDADGLPIARRPSPPTDVSLFADSGGAANLIARYAYASDAASGRAANEFVIWLGFDLPPDPETDEPVAVVPIVKSDGLAKLTYAVESQPEATVIYALVRTRRLGTPDIDSANSETVSVVATSTAPDSPAAGIFLGSIDQQEP